MLGFFFIFLMTAQSQNQVLADSLEHIYISGDYQAKDQLKILKELTQNQGDTKKYLALSTELILTAQKLDSTTYILDGYVEKGNALRLLGKLTEALESYFAAAEIAISMDSDLYLGPINTAIADVYSVMGNHENSIRYYKNALDLLRKEDDSVNIATALLNGGDEYFNQKKYDSALVYFEESSRIFKNINYPIGTAYNLGNMGMVYAEQRKDILAERNINEAIELLKELEDFYPISVYLIYMSDIYAKNQDWVQALSYAERSLDLAMQYGLKDQISEAYLQLHELNELQGMTEESLKNYKNHIIYRDSVTNISAVQEMADLRTNFEVSQKQIEVDLLGEQKKNQQLISFLIGIGLLAVLILAVGLIRRNKFIEKSRALIEMEKKRSDLLLLNILPEETATELKDRGKVKAKRFESVSVMFTDFKGFTAYSDKLSPEELVDSIDFYYSRFDEIVEKHGLEKIKTVGDAYMCAGGLTDSDQNNAHKMIAAAIEIADFVKESKKNDPDDMTRFDIRIGINTGPVVAGVVGKKKFAYDIWGDTVNIASRMESNSEPGKINVSEATYKLIKDQFICSYRGEIEAKNKGKMKMYFVERSIEKEIT
jgi:class 3 adenylate cyclase/tetratricopeptide (TPR) repeat protein